MSVPFPLRRPALLLAGLLVAASVQAADIVQVYSEELVNDAQYMAARVNV